MSRSLGLGVVAMIFLVAIVGVALQRSESIGVAALQFDLSSRELCFTVEASETGTPYDGHIHVWPAGVKGGIVVDFGAVDNQEARCVPVAATT